MFTFHVSHKIHYHESYESKNEYVPFVCTLRKWWTSYKDDVIIRNSKMSCRWCERIGYQALQIST